MIQAQIAAMLGVDVTVLIRPSAQLSAVVARNPLGAAPRARMIEERYGVTATTRDWNTVNRLARLARAPQITGIA